MSESKPYKGLRPYKQLDQDNFFGREAECRILLDKFLTSRLTLLFSASGVGKTSVLQAGVLSKLRDKEKSKAQAFYYRDWVLEPLTRIKFYIKEDMEAEGLLAKDIFPQAVLEGSFHAFMIFCTIFTHLPIVLILDQFEEFFQYHRYSSSRQAFLEEISHVIIDQDLPVHIVISMREDFALELNAFKPFLPTLLFDNFYRLEPLSIDSAKKAIVNPVQKFGFKYDPELLDVLLKDLSYQDFDRLIETPCTVTPDHIQPAHLQIVCSALWETEHNNSEKKIRLKTYQKKGESKGIVKSYVNDKLTNFDFPSLSKIIVEICACFKKNINISTLKTIPKDLINLTASVHLILSKKRIASKAFDYLMTRRGVKLAYTDTALAQIIKSNHKIVKEVLEYLREYHILRKQTRQTEDWYELYHDLFSQPLAEWNEAYKTKRRNWISLVSVIGLVIFLALTINQTHYYIRYGLNAEGINMVEAHKASWPHWFGRHEYWAELGYHKSDIASDKLKKEIEILDYNNAHDEIISNLAVEERILAYWENGDIKKALDLAKVEVLDKQNIRLEPILGILANFRLHSVKKFLGEVKSNDLSIQDKLEKIKVFMDSKPILMPVISVNLSFIPSNEIYFSKNCTDVIKSKDDGMNQLKLYCASLNHPEPSVRKTAVQELRQNKWPSEEFLNHTQDTDAEVRKEAVKSLNKDLSDSISKNSFKIKQALISRLKKDKDIMVRIEAARSLGSLGDAQTVMPLIYSLTHDRVPEVRAAVAEALGNIKNIKAVSALEVALKDKDQSVRIATAEALGKLGDNNAAHALLMRLRKLSSDLKEQRDQLEWNKLIDALGRLGDKDSVQPLIEQVINHDNNKYFDVNILTEALEKIPNGLESLQEKLKNDKSLSERKDLWLLLGKKQMTNAVDKVGDYLTKNDMDSQSAADILGFIGNAKALELLREICSISTREACAESNNAMARLSNIAGLRPKLDGLRDKIKPKEQFFTKEKELLIALGDMRIASLLFKKFYMLNGPKLAMAIDIWGALDDKRAVTPLIRLLRINASKPLTSDTGNDLISSNIIHALTQMNIVEALPIYREYLKHPDANVRYEAFLALAHLGKSSDLKYFMDGLDDPIGEVRRAALLALMEHVNINSNNPTAASPTLTKLADASLAEKVESIYLRPKEIFSVKLTAASILLKLRSEGNDNITAWLRGLADSHDASVRQQLAEILGRCACAGTLGNELVKNLFNDSNHSVKLAAIVAIGKLKMEDMLDRLYALLNNDSFIDIHIAVTEALGEMTAIESKAKTIIDNLKTTLNDKNRSIPVRLAALKTIGKQKDKESIRIILDAVVNDPDCLALVGYRIIGAYGKDAYAHLDRLYQKLNDIDVNYKMWRQLRDNNSVKNDKAHAAANFESFWAFSLAQAIARIDPDQKGVELLSHNLADVREGAWTGLAQTRDVALLKRLHEERNNSHDPLFRHAAYRALDELLMYLEHDTEDKELLLQELKNFYKTIEAEKPEGLLERLDWTIKEIEAKRSL
jgi:HEAT repeat protein